MKTVIRTAAFIVALSLMVSCLFSCDFIFGKDPTEVISGAEAALKQAPYTVNMGILFESEDNAMKAAIEKFASPVMKLKVDGDDLSVTMSLDLDGRKAESTYTLLDGVIYIRNYEEGADGISDEKMKSTYTEEIKAEILKELGDGANVRFDDFNESVARTIDGTTVVTCKDIKSDALKGVVDLLKSRLMSINAAVAVRDANLDIQIKDGKYEVTIFKCTYVITTETEVYTINMTYASEFDYASEVNVTAPADADEYEEVPFI